MDPFAGAQYSEDDAQVDRTEMQNLLIDLIRAAIDGREGLKAAAAAVSDDEVATQLSELAKSRDRTVASLFELATELRIPVTDIDDDGSTLGSIHRNWLKIHVAVTGDRGVIRSVLRAERRALDDFEDALSRYGLKQARRVFEQARTDVAHSVEELETLREALSPS